MLTSITPLGERGRQSTWGVTVTAFLLGGLAGGAAAGAVVGELGRLVIPHGVSVGARLVALAIALVAAAALDLRSDPVIGPRRQVNERWLDQFRGWIYGLGFGAQLGLGITTVISSAATYVTLVAAFLTRDPALGGLIGSCFGLIRGLTPLAAARVDRPERLAAFHARFDGRRAAVQRAAPFVLQGLAVIALGWAVL